jgi:uncharacterized cupin superfamily protein
MPERPNIYTPTFDPDEEHAGFFRRYSRLGRDAGARDIGATLMELPPGKTATPYHSHLGNEELLMVVAGTPSLRTPEGWRELEEGEVVSFPVGKEGAHQVSNFSDAPARVLVFSTQEDPDVVLMHDSEKVSVLEQAPGPLREGEWWIFPEGSAVVYWQGEGPPASPGGEDRPAR